jgi:hypothetical protein
MGVAVTLLWQSSYGDAARESIAKLCPQVGRLAARPPTTAENMIAPTSSSADQLNAFDLDEVGQNVEKISAPFAPAQEPATRSANQTTTAQSK